MAPNKDGRASKRPSAKVTVLVKGAEGTSCQQVEARFGKGILSVGSTLTHAMVFGASQTWAKEKDFQQAQTRPSCQEQAGPRGDLSEEAASVSQFNVWRASVIFRYERQVLRSSSAVDLSISVGLALID